MTDEQERRSIPAIRTATSADSLPLQRLLAEVFLEDPLMSWFLRPEPARARGAAAFFRYMVDSYGLPQGTAWVTDDLSGAALWMPPGRWALPAYKELISFPAVIRSFGWSGIFRKLRLRQTVDRHHPPEPHYYLAALGVQATRRGQGLGSRLLRPTLDRSDHDQVGCYLETSRERNVGFYERHGFRVTAELTFGDAHQPLWCLWRAPTPAAVAPPAREG